MMEFMPWEVHKIKTYVETNWELWRYLFRKRIYSMILQRISS
uniref:Uncharacterized protein n=1 Tax=Rhizophora mucronata TaxID=61149 RepID=A0A2P2N3T7_RHIMU